MNPTQLEELEERLRDLNLVVKVGQGLLLGAFGLGVWVTTIQIRINSHEQKVEEVAALPAQAAQAIVSLMAKPAPRACRSASGWH